MTMAGREVLAQLFEEHRGHLRSVAYRMLGSLQEADDAVQQAWLRLDRTDVEDVANLRGWLTTVVGRVCLDLLRARTARRELPLDLHLPDPVVTAPAAGGPEAEVVLADEVGFALLVVMDTLTPAERVAFVLHDMFSVPFEQIGLLLGRSANAAKQLATRSRARLRTGASPPEADLPRQHAAVGAFFAAARSGDFDALLALLDPAAEMRADGGRSAAQITAVLRGAAAIAGRAMMFARPDATVHPVLVNGAAGVVVTVDGRPISVMAFVVRDGTIIAIDVLADATRLELLDVASALP